MYSTYTNTFVYKTGSNNHRRNLKLLPALLPIIKVGGRTVNIIKNFELSYSGFPHFFLVHKKRDF